MVVDKGGQVEVKVDGKNPEFNCSLKAIENSNWSKVGGPYTKITSIRIVNFGP